MDTSDMRRLRIELGWFFALGCVLVVIKVLGLTTYSWWLITAPFWAPVALLSAIIVLVMIGCVIWGVLDYSWKRWWKP